MGMHDATRHEQFESNSVDFCYHANSLSKLAMQKGMCMKYSNKATNSYVMARSIIIIVYVYSIENTSSAMTNNYKQPYKQTNKLTN